MQQTSPTLSKRSRQKSPTKILCGTRSIDKIVFVNEPLWISTLYKIMNPIVGNSSLRNRLQVPVSWEWWGGLET